MKLLILILISISLALAACNPNSYNPNLAYPNGQISGPAAPLGAYTGNSYAQPIQPCYGNPQGTLLRP